MCVLETEVLTQHPVYWRFHLH